LTSARLRAWAPVVTLVLVYTALFGYLSLRRRWAMWHFDEDLAIYDQVVWNSSRGRLFASTLIQHADNMLGDHFSPIVAVFAPLYWLRATPSWLLLGQTAALAVAALPLYAFARPRLGARAATAVAAAYLAYPALHFVNLFQFHEIALIVLPLSCALLAIDRGHRGWFLASAVAVLLVKEEAAIVVVGLAFVWLLARRDWRMALGTTALGVGTGLLTMGVVLPRFNTADTGYYYVRRYAYLGDTPLEMAWTALTSPRLVLERLLAPDRLRYLAQLFGPVLLLPLVGWPFLAGALPVFGYLLLAESPDQYAIDRHYLSPLLPFLWFGAVLGVQRVGHWAAPALLVGSLAASYLFGPTPLSRTYDPGPDIVTAHTHHLRRFVSEVPPDAPVSANRNLLSWFSRRERVYRFPEVGDAHYVVLDFRELRHPAAFGLDGGAVGRLIESPDFRLADTADGALLFERGDPSAWPDARAGVATRFGDAIELVDFTIAPDEVRLIWRALAKPAASYQVFVHVLDARGERIAQRDGPPVDGLLPTDTWPAGRVVPERRRLATDGTKVQVGMYDGHDGKRLPVTQRGVPGGSDWVDLR
jgi:uncharacterized membrane protein